jgi:D-alanine-D-alanine ligase
LFHLPDDVAGSNSMTVQPLKVALVYNLKPHSSSTGEDQASGDSDDPPSSDGLPTKSFASPSRDSLSADDMYAEWDEIETIKAIHSALSEIHQVTLIEADRQVFQKLLTSKPDIVFNVAEGLYGVSREAQIPSLLEMLNIPYTGSDPLTLATCLDKARTKEILTYHGVKNPHFNVISCISGFAGAGVEFPSIVKPLHEGSSKGIYNSSVVHNWDELFREVKSVIEKYRQPALVEKYLPGREFTVALLGNGDDVRMLPIVEIKFDSLPDGVNPIYSYEAKWIWDRAEAPLNMFECPAKIPLSLQEEIESMCVKVFQILRCRDWCRIDIRLDDAGVPHVLEVNPLPGILPQPEQNSCFPKAARAAGISYNRLIQTVLHLAAQRYGLLKPREAVEQVPINQSRVA